MGTWSTTEQRDQFGNLLALRVAAVDTLGRTYYADIPMAVLSNVSQTVMANAIGPLVVAAALVATNPPGSVLTDEAIEQVALANGAIIAATD